MDKKMFLETGIKKDHLIITISGRIGGESSIDFYRKVKEILAECDNMDVIIDFGAVDFIDSSGLGSLVAINSHLLKNDKRLSLSAVPDNLLTLLKITNLTSILKIVEKPDDAIKSK